MNNDTSKILIGIAIGLVIAAVGYYLVLPNLALAPALPAQPETPTEEESEVCIQIITSAHNPETGQIREFPTPCDVPEGWEVIVNEIPGGLDDYQSQ